MSKRITAIAMAGYAAVAVLTFGAAANSAFRQYEPEYRRCVADPKCTPLTVPQEPAVYTGLIGGMLWPLYWSWQLADAQDEQSQ